ncbi:MAG: DUF4233 domain-containing protein [Candidatus Nanopelagicaceae bacterium]|jgi:hypothetical protein
MKILARSVLTMEAITMGFALLLVRLDYQGAELTVGIVISLLLILCAGLLRSRFGWILGWALQGAILLYGFVIPSMFFMGGIFAALWVAAIHFGKKGEAMRAAMIAERESGAK